MKIKILCIGILFIFLSPLSMSFGEKKPTLKADKKYLPDLTVKLEIKAQKEGTGYSVTPRYVVTNNGMLAARNFKVVLWHLYRSSPKSRPMSVLWSTNTISSLGGKQSWTFDYDPINTAGWYPDKGGQVGFRVFADAYKVVTELNEGNNSITKYWPPQFRRMKPKVFKKD